MSISSILSSKQSRARRAHASTTGRAVLARAALAGAARSSVELLEGRQLLSGSGFVGILGDIFLGDTTGPTATVAAGSVTTGGGATLTATVEYADGSQVDSSSLGIDDVVLVLPGGTEVAPTAFATQVGNSLGTVITGVYTFAAPGGTIDAADSGTYAVRAKAGAVADAFGNPSAEANGTITINVVDAPVVVPPVVDVPPADTTVPTAVIGAIAPVTTAGGSSMSVTVTYTDEGGIKLSTVNSVDVEAKVGGKKLSVAGVEATPSGDGKTVTAVYTLTAPGGAWDYKDNGTGTFELKASAVSDLSGNRTAAAEAAFTVDIDAPAVPPPPVVVPPPPPAAAPVASVTPVGKVAVAGTKPNTVTVTYTDSDGVVDASSLGLDDISVVGPGGTPVAVNGISILPQVDSNRITATYSITAPGGSWDAADNGAYTVSVVAGAATDNGGLGSAAVATAFNVDVPIPAPVIDGGFSGGAPVNAGFVAEASIAVGSQLLLVGRQGDLNAGTSQYVLKRLNADGSADLSFGKGGVAVSAVGANAAAFAVAVGDDGSIYVAGTAGGDLTVTKFKAGGSVDGKFGSGGAAVVDLGSSLDRGLGIAVAGTSVVVVGTNGSKAAVVKLTAKGGLNAGFGTGGVVATAAANSALSGVAVTADGRIVAGGSIGDKVAVYRYNADGSADNSFGGNGLVVVPGLAARTDLGTADTTVSVALQGDKVLVSGRVNGDFAVARLNADGSLDNGFDGGIAVVDLGGDDDADQIILQGTGQVLVVGTSEQGTSVRLGVAVLNEDGSLDAGFGTGGTASLDSGIEGTGRALHVGQLVVRAFAAAQQNGQLVVGAGQGGTTVDAAASSGLRRLNVPGSGSLGTFGLVNGRKRKLSFADNDGTRVTVSLTGGGTAKALYDGTTVDIVITGSTSASVLSVATKGGDKLFRLRNVTSNGPLKAIRAKGAKLEGAIAIPGGIGSVELRSLGTGASLATTGEIGSVKVGGDVDGAFILAGTSLGSDYKFGGIGTAQDGYAAGAIGSIKVGGTVRRSIFAAGLQPEDGKPFQHDVVLSPATSRIKSISAKGGLDAVSRVIAGGVGSAKVPGKVDPLSDGRFEIITA